MVLTESGTAMTSVEAGANTGILAASASSLANILLVGGLTLGALYLIFRRR